jgi:competence ComEA-like helix-hairpin-helix protein
MKKGITANKRFFIVFLLIFGAGFLILPKICLADNFGNIDLLEMEKHLSLPDDKAEGLIHSLINLFTSKWIDEMASPMSSNEEERAVPSIMRGAVRIQALNYLLIDAPVDVGFQIVKNSIKIARVFLTQDISGVLDELEKESVKKAVSYGMNVLLAKEVRISPGAIKFRYKNQNKETKETIFQYIMVYRPVSMKKGDLLIRFYSREYLDPPENKGSAGGMTGYYTVLTHPLPPFIINIQGMVEDYQWVKKPSISIIFPEHVPDLGLKPLGFWQRHFIKPIKKQINDVEVIIAKLTGVSPKFVEKISKITASFVGFWRSAAREVKRFTRFGKAGVGGSLIGRTSENTDNQNRRSEEQDQIGRQTGQETSQQSKDETPLRQHFKKPSLEAIQEKLDDLSENLDIVNQEVAETIKQSRKGIVLVKKQTKEEASQQEVGNKENQTEEINKNNQENDNQNGKTAGSSACSTDSIDINTASQKELEKLVGVGPIYSQRIIESRPFFSLQDLTKVKGIGDKTLEKIINQGCAYTNLYPNHVSSVFNQGGVGGSSGSSSNSSQTCSPKSIEINSAAKEELDKLVGIGETLAKRIIQSRPFSSLQGLTKVKGIGEAALGKIKEQGCAYVKSQGQVQPVLEVLPTSIEFSIVENDTYQSQKQTLTVSQTGSDLLYWQSAVEYDTSSGAKGWLAINLSSGSLLENDSVNLSVLATESVSDLTVGNYKASIIIADSDNQAATKSISVALAIQKKEKIKKPRTEEPSQEVVINEIAWMGTKASSSDEWIELYNTTDTDIDIANWSIYGADTGKCLNFDSADGFSTTVIKANSYLLYANHQDDVKDNNGSNLVDVWDATISLNNSSPGQIMLYDTADCQSGLVDIVNQEAGDWFVGGNTTKQTMERVNPKSSGADGENWKNNNLIIINGKDGNGNPIYGTPKAKNSASISPTEISHNLEAFDDNNINQITLPFSNSPYIVKTNLVISESKILNIEPGVVLKFYDQYSGIKANGTLKAKGTENKSIVFTSILDTDSQSNNPTAGSWRGIYFSPTSNNSQLEYVSLKYAGADPAGTPCSPNMAGIRVENASISIKNSTIEHNQYRGIYLIDSDSAIDNVQLKDNPVCCPASNPTCHNQYGGYGLEIKGGQPSVENSLFNNSYYGIYIHNSTQPLIKNNDFKDNQKAAIWLAGGLPQFGGNQAADNGINGIFVSQGAGGYLVGKETIWPKADLPYIINGVFDVSSGAVLILKPGTVFKFYDKNSGLKVEGTLKAVGQENKKIVFTSLKDDDYGGDANNDGLITQPAPGDWDKLYFASTSRDSQLEDIVVRYAGGGSVWPMAGLEVEESGIDLKNSTIENNNYSGFYFISSILNTDSLSNYPLTAINNVRFSGNKRLFNNQEQGFNFWIDGGNISVKDSLFESSVYGIYIHKGEPSLDEASLTFGTGDEANSECNIYRDGKCVNPLNSP